MIEDTGMDEGGDDGGEDGGGDNGMVVMLMGEGIYGLDVGGMELYHWIGGGGMLNDEWGKLE